MSNKTHSNIEKVLEDRWVASHTPPHSNCMTSRTNKRILTLSESPFHFLGYPSTVRIQFFLLPIISCKQWTYLPASPFINKETTIYLMYAKIICPDMCSNQIHFSKFIENLHLSGWAITFFYVNVLYMGMNYFRRLTG